MKLATSIKPKVSGIYIIRCNESGKIYVGSSVNMRARYSQHKGRLKRGVHTNEHLQSAYKLYGGGAFEFDVLELIEDRDSLQIREQYWMDTTRCCNREVGYNVAISAENRRLAEETKQKMSRIAQQRPASYYDYAKALYTGRPISEEQRRQISRTLKGRKVPIEITRKKVDSVCKFRYTLTAPDGQIHETINPAQFARDKAISVAHIYAMRDGTRRSTKGWRLISCEPR